MKPPNPDEQELMDMIYFLKDYNVESPSVLRCVVNMEMNHKRACYILGKWTDRGWYEYGVNILYGWLTDKAPRSILNELKEIAKEKDKEKDKENKKHEYRKLKYSHE